MERIAFIIEETFIYWSSILLALAVLAAVCMFLCIYLSKGRNGAAAAAFVPLAMLLSTLLARLIHWYCRTDAYASLEDAMTNPSGGGYALMGVFFGCILAACLLRLVRIVKNLPELLDALALAGGLGIAIGRLACLYNTADRGMSIQGITGLPLVYPVENAVSGVAEYRLATFMLQAITVGVIFLALLLFYTIGRRRRHIQDGDTALLFLAAYGASQVLWDSTRYDSLYFRSNGFISIVQILGAIALVIALVVFSVRMVRALGWKFRYLGLWLGAAALIGGAAYMEYYVQRHGDQALFAYSVMGVCLICVVGLIALIRILAVRQERKLAYAGTLA